MRNLPEHSGQKVRVDVPGFVIFGLAIGAITIFFSYYKWWLLVVAAVFLIVFALYIRRADHPFLTPQFLHNTNWLLPFLVIVIIYFVNFSFTPIFNVMGPKLYGMSAAHVSLALLPGYIVATIVGVLSGRVVDKIGSHATIIIATSLLVAGLVLNALCTTAGMAWLAVGSCLFYAGYGLLYSPLTSTVLSALSSNEQGRGIGMNDLAMNVSPSTGTAIFGGLLASPQLGGWSITGVTGSAVIYSNLFLIYAIIVAVGLVYYLFIHTRIATK